MDRIYGISTFGGKFKIESMPVVKATAKRIVVDNGKEWTGYREHLDRSEVDWTPEDAVARFVSRAMNKIEQCKARIESEQQSIDKARAALAVATLDEGK